MVFIVGMVGVAVFATPEPKGIGTALAWCVPVGGIAQLALVYWAAKGERDRSGRRFVTKVRHRGGRERRVDVG